MSNRQPLRSLSPLGVLALASLAAAPARTQSQFGTDLRTQIPPIGTQYITAAIGDLDGDGDQDLFLGAEHQAPRVFFNDGLARFTDGTARAIPASFQSDIHDVDLADIDGDGDLDVLIANGSLPTSVWINSGSGVFTDRSATALPQGTAHAVDGVVADFDGDGDLDWFVASYFGASRLYLNDGTGRFPTSAPIGVAVEHAYEGEVSRAVDLDADGDLDIAICRSPAVVLINQGGTTFAPAPPTVPTSGLRDVVDLDGDGRPDLLFADGQQVAFNTGGLRFASVVQLPGEAWASADIEGDGDVDLIGDGFALTNDGSAAFSRQAEAALSRTGRPRLAFGDLDGDGDLDVLDYSMGRIAVNLGFHVTTLGVPSIGGVYVLRLQARNFGMPPLCALYFSPRRVAIPLLSFGTLRLDPALAQPLATVSFFRERVLSIPIPNDPALRGLEVNTQGLVFTPGRRGVFLSNTVSDTIR